MDQSIEIYEHARATGYIDLTGTTNGFWAKHYDQGLMQARRLRHAGVTSLELSADSWHQAEVGSEAISNCIEVCRKVGIAINLRLLASHSHRHQEALLTLRPKALSKVNRITCSKVFSVGRAKKELPRTEVYQKGIGGNCYSASNLTVNAFGNVYPCCAGLDQTNKIKFGNIKAISIQEAVRTIEASAVYRTIAFCGVEHYHPILKEAGIDLGDPNAFGNACDFCWTIFSDQRCVDIIQDYHCNLAKRSLAAAIHHLESRINSQRA
jgi:MoaA/NifB/PqqE/SkfB family radical SAM enzyme